MTSQALFALAAFGTLFCVLVIAGIGLVVARKLDRKYGTENE